MKKILASFVVFLFIGCSLPQQKREAVAAKKVSCSDLISSLLGSEGQTTLQKDAVLNQIHKGPVSFEVKLIDIKPLYQSRNEWRSILVVGQCSEKTKSSSSTHALNVFFHSALHEYLSKATKGTVYRVEGFIELNNSSRKKETLTLKGRRFVIH